MMAMKVTVGAVGTPAPDLGARCGVQAAHMAPMGPRTVTFTSPSGPVRRPSAASSTPSAAWLLANADLTMAIVNSILRRQVVGAAVDITPEERKDLEEWLAGPHDVAEAEFVARVRQFLELCTIGSC